MEKRALNLSRSRGAIYDQIVRERKRPKPGKTDDGASDVLVSRNKPGGLICTFVHEQTVLARPVRSALCGTIRHTAATDNSLERCTAVRGTVLRSLLENIGTHHSYTPKAIR